MIDNRHLWDKFRDDTLAAERFARIDERCAIKAAAGLATAAKKAAHMKARGVPGYTERLVFRYFEALAELEAADKLRVER